MESWKRVWRVGIAPLLSLGGLRGLLKGLESNDPRLLQEVTIRPLCVLGLKDEDCEAACALTYTGWKNEEFSERLQTVDELDEYFARMCFECDQLLGEPGGVRWFLNWYDSTPRQEVFKLLSEEVRLTILNREQQMTEAQEELHDVNPELNSSGLCGVLTSDAELETDEAAFMLDGHGVNKILVVKEEDPYDAERRAFFKECYDGAYKCSDFTVTHQTITPEEAARLLGYDGLESAQKDLGK